MSVKPLSYEIKDLGKYMKSSKKKYIWRFEISNREHRIELEYSLLSGKRKIIEDGKVLFEGAQVLGAAFQFPFTLEGNNLNIIQQGETFELRINNQVFTHLWQQEKTKSEFQYEEDANKKENEESGFSFGASNEKKRFSVTVNFAKKEPKKSEDIKFPSPPPNSMNMDSSTFSQMTSSMPFPQDFSNFSKIQKKANTEFDFGSFDFNKFGQSNAPQNQNEAQSGKPDNKFTETNFANLGKFSVHAIKKPPVINNPQMTQSNVLPKNNTIDLLDLMDEPPKKEEKNPGITQPTNTSNWDPFSAEKIGSSPTIDKSSVSNPPGFQPQLFDIVFTDPSGPKKEEKPETEANKNGNVNLQDVFSNPQNKEAEDRAKKISLLDNAFGPSYNVTAHAHVGNPMMPNMGNMNMNNNNNMMYFSQQMYPNQNMTPNFLPQNGGFPMVASTNVFAMQNMPPMQNNMQSYMANAFNNAPAQGGFSNQITPQNNNLPATPFDQFK